MSLGERLGIFINGFTDRNWHDLAWFQVQSLDALLDVGVHAHVDTLGVHQQIDSEVVQRSIFCELLCILAVETFLEFIEEPVDVLFTFCFCESVIDEK